MIHDNQVQGILRRDKLKVSVMKFQTKWRAEMGLGHIPTVEDSSLD